MPLKSGASRQVISENIANADSTASGPGGDPFRRKIATFTSQIDRALDARTVALGPVRTDPSDFISKHEPGHPSADANGYVKRPNINPLIEMNDMREAQRSYEANLKVIEVARGMLTRTIDLLR